jgi:predicted chitinase
MPNLSLGKAEAYLPYLNAAMEEFEINSKLRIAAFLSQLAAESGEFKWFNELASGAEYEGRKNLGNTHPGDGKRYKGRGPIQLTGRNNYRKAGEALGLDLEGNPELASSPEVAFRTAGWYWYTNHINKYADKGDIRAVTLLINAGRSSGAMPARAHFPERQAYYEKALSALKNFTPEESTEEFVDNNPVILPDTQKKPLETGTNEKEENVEGTMPPVPAAEVKASEVSLLTRITSFSIPAGVMTALAAIGKFIGGLPPSVWIAFSVIMLVAMIIGYLIWRQRDHNAHERTKIVMNAAADPNKNNLRLV